MSIYQAACIRFHLARGDFCAAVRCAGYPPAWFAAGDLLMVAAYLAGARDALNGETPD